MYLNNWFSMKRILVIMVFGLLTIVPIRAQEEAVRNRITCDVTMNGSSEVMYVLSYSLYNGLFHWDGFKDVAAGKETRLVYSMRGADVASVIMKENGEMVLTAVCNDYGEITSMVLVGGASVNCRYNSLHQLVAWVFNDGDYEYTDTFEWDGYGDLVAINHPYSRDVFTYSYSPACYDGAECGLYPFEPSTPGYNLGIGRLFATGLLGVRPTHELVGFIQDGGSMTFSYRYDGSSLVAINEYYYYDSYNNGNVMVELKWR